MDEAFPNMLEFIGVIDATGARNDGAPVASLVTSTELVCPGEVVRNKGGCAVDAVGVKVGA